MSVSLSPIGGVAAQFFDNNGNVLAGGKLYSYEAGTTTPKTTYTSYSGTIANSNPIILTSAGRIPYEVWLTTGDSYKFVLTDSVGNQIGTWDNIYGYSSGSVDAQTEVQTATAGQTLFVLTTMAYTPGANTLGVYVDGVNQVVNNAYVETNATSVTFVSGLHVGATVKFINLNIGSTDASVVSYEPGPVGSVATTVQAKLRESVSVLDFGASPDATAAVNGAAFQAALTYVQNQRAKDPSAPGIVGGTLFVPAGLYNIDRSLEVGVGVTLQGESVFGSVLQFDGSISGAGSYCVSVGPSTLPGWSFGYTFATQLRDIGISAAGTEDYVVLVPGMHQHSMIDNVNIRGVKGVGLQLNGTGGPAYNIVKRVSIATSNLAEPDRAGIVCNENAGNSYLEAISIEAEYGQSFAIGIDIIGTNVNINTAHFAYCTTGIRLASFTPAYTSDLSTYIRFAHDDASGPSTNLIYVDSGYPGGFVIEGTYSYAVPIGTPGCKILNNQITGQSIPSSKTVNYYRYPEWVSAYTEPQTADPVYPSFTPAITADVDNTGDPLTQPAVVIKQSGTTYANFIPGYGNGFVITGVQDSFRFWPTGCQYIADVDAFLPTASGVDLGSGTYRWDTVYATNGTINTSDANEKQQIQDLSAAEKAVALTIKGQVRRFKFNSAVAEKGSAARIHVGVIAQEVQAAFESQGLNPDDYAIFCRDTWYEVDGKKFDEATGKDYTIDSAGAVAVTRLGIRYEELLAFIIGAM